VQVQTDLVQNKEFVSLLDNLERCLKTYSVKELNEALVTFFTNKQDNSLEINFILEQVASEYSISKRTLIRSTARGSVQEAREVAYCLLHLNLGLTLRYISLRIFFKNSHTSITRAVEKCRNLSPSSKQDKDFKTIYEKIQKKLTEFIIENKQE